MTTSPPTHRVVAVLNLLASSDVGLTASEVARRIGANGSTTALVLTGLNDAGYVERAGDKAYRLGPGLLPVVESLRKRYPLLGLGHDELQRLHDEVGYSCSLTRIASDHLLVVALAGDADQLPPGAQPGRRLPIGPPYGCVAMAWRPSEEIDSWLDGSSVPLDEVERAHYRRVIAGIAERGWGAWSLEPASGPLIEEIRMVLAGLAADPVSAPLREQLSSVFATVGRHGYTAEDLLTRSHLSVSYIVVPIFGPDGRPRYQIECHVLRPTMTSQELQHAADGVLAAARALQEALAGHEPGQPSTKRGFQ